MVSWSGPDLHSTGSSSEWLEVRVEHVGRPMPSVFLIDTGDNCDNCLRSKSFQRDGFTVPLPDAALG